jgi:hypothetical protein
MHSFRFFAVSFSPLDLIGPEREHQCIACAKRLTLHPNLISLIKAFKNVYEVINSSFVSHSILFIFVQAQGNAL